MSGIGTNTSLLLTGFVTYASTAPVIILGSLQLSGVVYFTFSNYSVAMTQPSLFQSISFQQSNSIVGKAFVGSLNLTGLLPTDYLVFPASVYVFPQPDCSSNCHCQIGGKVVLQDSTNISGVFSISVNLINPAYYSNQSVSLNSFDVNGFAKKTGTFTISTLSLNSLTAVYTQSKPYFNETSTYQLNVTLSGSSSKFLQLTIPI